MAKANEISAQRRTIIDRIALGLKRPGKKKKPTQSASKKPNASGIRRQIIAPPKRDEPEAVAPKRMTPAVTPVFKKTRMDQFYYLLLAQRNELIEDVQKKSDLLRMEVLIDDDRSASGNHIGESHLSDPSPTEGQIFNRQKRLKKIDEAIQRIAEGTYGICQSCNRPIGIKRLQLTPIANLCVPCKETQEQKEKRSNGGNYHRPYTIDEPIAAAR